MAGDADRPPRDPDPALAAGGAAALLPVSVITGFLGSGKTTLLGRLLAHPGMGETAVLVNEFGEVGIDHLLLRKIDEDVVLLNSGCLCCAVRDDLVETLDELMAKRKTGQVPPFARVVVETTGLADPAPILHTLISDPALIRSYRLLTLVATLDAVHIGRQLDEHPEAAKQAAMADRLVMTKTDLARGAALASVRRRLRRLNPGAPCFEASLESGPAPGDLFDIGFSLTGKTADVRRWLEAEAHAERGGGHAPDGERHDERVGSFCLTFDAPVEWDDLVEWLKLLLASRGEELLRLKGILNIAGRSNPVVIQGVQHVFYPPAELPAWPDRDRRSRIVFITRDLSRAAVEASLSAFLGQAPRPA